MKICIIDDDDGKRAQIAAIVTDVSGGSARITEGASVNAARQYLKGTKFDLLIIDIALPNYDREEPKLNGGIDFLDEIIRAGRFVTPDHIIGITAHDDIFSGAASRFGGELWSIIKYDLRSLEWQDGLRAKLQHIIRAKNSAPQEPSPYDLGIVVALKTPEFDAMMDLNWGWSRIETDGDPGQFYEGRFDRKDGSEGRAVLARSASMGMPSAAVVATKVGLRFRPRILCMTGICAGVRGETHLGDVIVANPTWDYGSGKYSSGEDGKEVFEQSNYHFGLSSRIRGLVEPLEGETEALSEIRKRFPGEKPATVTRLHVGPFASGAAVIARDEIMQWIKNQNRKLMAVDMEAHAIACAAHEMPPPVMEFLVVKGVSDFADEAKGDKERRFAAYASAAVLAHLAEKCGL